MYICVKFFIKFKFLFLIFSVLKRSEKKNKTSAHFKLQTRLSNLKDRHSLQFVIINSIQTWALLHLDHSDAMIQFKFAVQFNETVSLKSEIMQLICHFQIPMIYFYLFTFLDIQILRKSLFMHRKYHSHTRNMNVLEFPNSA